MNRKIYNLFFFTLLFFFYCSKEKDLVSEEKTEDISINSNILEDPELLIGSWTLIQKKLSETSCQAKNIHFLENNNFYIDYNDKRYKGTHIILDSTSIELTVGSKVLGSVNNIDILGNNISFDLNIQNECNDEYTGRKYFRIHQFIWTALNDFYLWQGEVEQLSDDIKPIGSATYNDLINSNPEPEAFFESLKHPEDKYSQIRSNYDDLMDNIRGIEASNGVEFILARYGSENGVLGLVTHILKESNAIDKDVKRGDIFIGVNGESLNMNNYRELLFGENLTYTLNMADVNDNLISLNGKNITLNKQENFQTNPIQISRIIENGGVKIGYLMYNQFALGQDDELNSVFAEFKTNGVEELILDLRYNGGGVTTTALYLSGMITGQFEGEIFSQSIWNKKVMKFYEDQNLMDRTRDLFVSTIGGQTTINSLNLNRLFVITSGRTASASEMLINGLSPYINVVQIGGTTYGKNVGGLAVVYDYIDNNDPPTINPDHTYGLSPITFRIANGEGFSDYADGLKPSNKLTLAEDFENMGVLGEITEPLLALAINELNFSSSKLKVSKPSFPVENIIDDPNFIKLSVKILNHKFFPNLTGF